MEICDKQDGNYSSTYFDLPNLENFDTIFYDNAVKDFNNLCFLLIANCLVYKVKIKGNVEINVKSSLFLDFYPICSNNLFPENFTFISVNNLKDFKDKVTEIDKQMVFINKLGKKNLFIEQTKLREREETIRYDLLFLEHRKLVKYMIFKNIRIFLKKFKLRIRQKGIYTTTEEGLIDKKLTMFCVQSKNFVV